MTIKVLVLDRTHTAEQLAKETLVPLGCQIITASSTALAIFLARKNFPSLLIAGLSGADDYLDLPGEIQADEDLAHIPIVFVALNGQKLNNSGANKTLSMPIEPSTFIAELLPYLRESVDERPEETPE